MNKLQTAVRRQKAQSLLSVALLSIRCNIETISPTSCENDKFDGGFMFLIVIAIPERQKKNGPCECELLLVFASAFNSAIFNFIKISSVIQSI